MKLYAFFSTSQDYLKKLQAIRLQNYQERKRILQRVKLYQAPAENVPEVTKPEVEWHGRVDEKSDVSEKLSASPPSAITPPTSPPPKLDPEDRRRKIAALKVRMAQGFCFSLTNRTAP